MKVFWKKLKYIFTKRKRYLKIVLRFLIQQPTHFSALEQRWNTEKRKMDWSFVLFKFVVIFDSAILAVQLLKNTLVCSCCGCAKYIEKHLPDWPCEIEWPPKLPRWLQLFAEKLNSPSTLLPTCFQSPFQSCPKRSIASFLKMFDGFWTLPITFLMIFCCS